MGKKPSTTKSNSKLCRHCHHELPIQASYCATCGSYQDWRRHFQISKAAAAIVLGIMAAAGISVQQAYQYFRPERADLYVSAAKTNDFTKVTLNVVNRGGTTGFVEPSMACESDGSHLSYKASGPLIVPAKSEKQMEMNSNSTWAVRLQDEMVDVGPLSLGEASTYLDDFGGSLEFLCSLQMSDETGELSSDSFVNNQINIWVPSGLHPALISAHFTDPDLEEQ